MLSEAATSTVEYFESGRHLWRSVIARALSEANGDDLVPISRGERRRPQMIQEAAVKWLTNDTWELRCIYHLAQVSRVMEFGEWLRGNREKYDRV